MEKNTVVTAKQAVATIGVAALETMSHAAKIAVAPTAGIL